MFRQLLFCTISAILLSAPLATGRILNVPDAYASIQSAIDAASASDTVLVAEGIYFENISFRGKMIVVASSYILDQNPLTIKATIIDGSSPAVADSGSVVRMTKGEPEGTVLSGFTLQNGIGTLIPGSFAGGGVLVTGAGNPRISNCIVYNCSALFGAGIAVRNSAAVIVNTVLYNNSANQGGGLATDNASVDFDHNIIHQNSADLRGGGIYESNSFLRISNSSITSNTSATAGAF